MGNPYILLFEAEKKARVSQSDDPSKFTLQKVETLLVVILAFLGLF